MKKWSKMEPKLCQNGAKMACRGDPNAQQHPRDVPECPQVAPGSIFGPFWLQFWWFFNGFYIVLAWIFWCIFDAFGISVAVFQAVGVRGAVALCRKLGRPICRNILQYGNPLYDVFPRAPRGGGSATWIHIFMYLFACVLFFRRATSPRACQIKSN